MKKSSKTTIIITFLVIAAVVLLGWGNIAAIFNGHNTTGQTTRELAMSCTLDMYTQFHIHPHLTIIINGLEQSIPANTGITISCMHPIHTHDETGTIHVESPEQRDFTLSDFFAVWGQTFTKDQILDYKVDATHQIVMTVNGVTSTDYENLVLRDLDNIKIEYKNK